MSCTLRHLLPRLTPVTGLPIAQVDLAVEVAPALLRQTDRHDEQTMAVALPQLLTPRFLITPLSANPPAWHTSRNRITGQRRCWRVV